MQSWNYNSNKTITLRSNPRKAISIEEGGHLINTGKIWIFDVIGENGNRNQHWKFINF